MTVTMVVVCEADADFRLASGLADRMLIEKVDWLEPEMIEHVRTFRGLASDVSFIVWTRIDDEARALRIKVHGGFRNEPTEIEAKMVRQAILTVRKVHGDDVALLLIRDEDRQERRAGFEQARRYAAHPERIVLGLARFTRECWVLAGFDPRNNHETQLLQDCTTRLGFDPRTAAQRLSRKPTTDRRGVKQVVTELVADDWKREAACWEESDLALLRSRGSDTGLADYLDEVEQRLVPFVTPTRPT